MNRHLNTAFAFTLAASTLLAPGLASAQAEGSGTGGASTPGSADTGTQMPDNGATTSHSGGTTATSGAGTTRDTNDAAGATSSGQAGSLTNGNNTGEGGSADGATPDISGEQDVQIRDAITQEGTKPADIGMDVQIGVVVPSDRASLHPLPAGIIKIVPAFAGYQYVLLADGRIVIVEPASLRVVHIVRT
jgi:hypothetical protein